MRAVWFLCGFLHVYFPLQRFVFLFVGLFLCVPFCIAYINFDEQKAIIRDSEYKLFAEK